MGQPGRTPSLFQSAKSYSTVKVKLRQIASLSYSCLILASHQLAHWSVMIITSQSHTSNAAEGVSNDQNPVNFANDQLNNCWVEIHVGYNHPSHGIYV